MGTDSSDCVQHPLRSGSYMFSLAVFVIVFLSVSSALRVTLDAGVGH